jgi:uncharacterized protein YndB with AHSA1/START domain
MRSTVTVLFTLLFLAGSIAAQTIQNTSFQALGQERVLRLEVVVPSSTEIVWAAFSTVEGLQRWAAPVVALDLRAGGSLRAHYDEGAEIGSPGTIETTILNYLERELITFKVNLNDRFPEEVRAGDANLQELVQFVPLENGGTRLVSTMVGWGSGPEWEEAYNFFARGNEWTYRQLVNALEEPAAARLSGVEP